MSARPSEARRRDLRIVHGIGRPAQDEAIHKAFEIDRSRLKATAEREDLKSTLQVAAAVVLLAVAIAAGMLLERDPDRFRAILATVCIPAVLVGGAIGAVTYWRFR